MPISDGKANAVLEDIFGDGYISLHTGDPGNNGANEVTGGSYARQDLSTLMAAAASRAITNDTIIQFTDMPAATVTHWGIWTAVTAGTFEWGAALTTQRVLVAGDDPKFEVGDLDADFT